MPSPCQISSYEKFPVKDIDCQSRPSRFTCMKTRQKTTNWVWIWLEKLGKWAHGKTKTGVLNLCHEDIMDIRFRLMTNHRMHLANAQSGLLRILQLGTLIESEFLNGIDPEKCANGFVMS